MVLTDQSMAEMATKIRVNCILHMDYRPWAVPDMRPCYRESLDVDTYSHLLIYGDGRSRNSQGAVGDNRKYLRMPERLLRYIHHFQQSESGIAKLIH